MKKLKLFLGLTLLLMIGVSLNGQNQWDIRLRLDGTVDCNTGAACYILEVQSGSGVDWALGDQNYRLFFDGDAVDIGTITSLLPAGYTLSIGDNDEYSGQGQEAASPLDNIDDNLGFLELNYVQNDKSDPTTATQITTGGYTEIAQICVTVADAVLQDNTGSNCVHFYHSRPSTAGNFTIQYTVMTENNAPNFTTQTTASNYDDLTPADGDESCLGSVCNPAPPPVAENLPVLGWAQKLLLGMMVFGLAIFVLLRRKL